MIIEYGNSIEQILKKNLHKGGNEPIIGVGVNVMVKTFNYENPFFYKSCIEYLYKKDLDILVSDEDVKKDNVFNRQVVAVKVNINTAIGSFRSNTGDGKLVEVLENDWWIKKLINIDTIQEVQGFVFDPQERLKKYN